MWTQVKRRRDLGQVRYPSRVGPLGRAGIMYPSRVGPPGRADIMDRPERPASLGRSGSGARVPADPWSQRRGSSCSWAGGPGSERGAQGRETVVPAPPARWPPGRGWCRCQRGPWYRRAARTGSRRGPPRSSADTKPWFPQGSARGTRCHRPCPTRGMQRKVSLGMGQILPATRLPVWASKGQFRPWHPQEL